MAPAELPITGYLSRLSARPGESIVAHVSVRDGGAYRARLLRVICADPHPQGPGRRYEDMAGQFDQTFKGTRQPIHLGSHVAIPSGPQRDTGTACTWTALVWPGLDGRVQAVISDGAATLSVGPHGARGRHCGDDSRHRPAARAAAVAPVCGCRLIPPPAT